MPFRDAHHVRESLAVPPQESLVLPVATTRTKSTSLRCFASVPSFSEEQDKWGRTTKEILCSSVGSLNPDSWAEAVNAIYWHLESPTYERVQTSFELLDRLIQEKIASRENGEGTLDENNSALNTVLEEIVSKWRVLCDAKPKSIGRLPTMLQPMLSHLVVSSPA